MKISYELVIDQEEARPNSESLVREMHEEFKQKTEQRQGVRYNNFKCSDNKELVKLLMEPVQDLEELKEILLNIVER